MEEENVQAEETTSSAKLSVLPDVKIGKVYAVVSGKGGVGKSLITSQMATQLNNEGYRVGVLDADVTGPTMARAFGFENVLHAGEAGIYPNETYRGIKVVSANMILPEETTPVLWRGGIISNLISQFYSEVLWGELDYLLIDMPPGTGDVALTVFQDLPIDGIIIVTAPQDLVSMIVGKALNMAELMAVSVVGIVENMAYFICPDCGSEHRIFGDSSAKELAEEYGIELSVSLPINPVFAEMMDNGEAESIRIPELKPFTEALTAK